MSIDTRIDGDPESIRRSATWLQSTLQANVHSCGNQIYRARTHAESSWRGDASSAFQEKMSSAGKGADVVDTDTGQLARSFYDYADDLHTAQSGMRRAREIACEAGLAVNGDVIEEPGPAPTSPQGATTPEQPHALNQAVQDHHRQVRGYIAAREEADRARGIVNNAKAFGRSFWSELENKKYFNAAEFVNNAGDGLLKKHQSALSKEADRLAQEAKTAQARYLASSGGSPEAKFQEKMRLGKTMAAEDLKVKAADAGRRFGSKLPVIGLGITAAGVGYEIHQGKPPGKAVVSGFAGAAAGALACAVVPGVGWAAAAGIVAGTVVGMGADYAWDQWVPDGAKEAINEGLTDVGNAVADAGDAVGDFVGDIF